MNVYLVNLGIELMVNPRGSYLPQKEKELTELVLAKAKLVDVVAFTLP